MGKNETESNLICWLSRWKHILCSLPIAVLLWAHKNHKSLKDLREFMDWNIQCQTGRKHSGWVCNICWCSALAFVRQSVWMHLNYQVSAFWIWLSFENWPVPRVKHSWNSGTKNMNLEIILKYFTTGWYLSSSASIRMYSWNDIKIKKNN